MPPETLRLLLTCVVLNLLIKFRTSVCADVVLQGRWTEDSVNKLVLVNTTSCLKQSNAPPLGEPSPSSVHLRPTCPPNQPLKVSVSSPVAELIRNHKDQTVRDTCCFL